MRRALRGGPPSPEFTVIRRQPKEVEGFVMPREFEECEVDTPTGTVKAPPGSLVVRYQGQLFVWEA